MVSVKLLYSRKLFDVDSHMDVRTSVATSWSCVYWVLSGAIDISAADYWLKMKRYQQQAADQWQHYSRKRRVVCPMHWPALEC